jgi:hypothetical protein
MQKKGDRSLKKSDRPFFLIKAGNRQDARSTNYPKAMLHAAQRIAFAPPTTHPLHPRSTPLLT